MSVFSDRLKELRGAESQASFADQIDLNRVQYAKYESGKNIPSIEILSKICRVHAVSSDWLLGLSNNCSVRQNNYVRASSGGIAIGGNVSGTVTTTRNPQLTTRNPPTCSKCPFKAKLKALEKVMKK